MSRKSVPASAVELASQVSMQAIEEACELQNNILKAIENEWCPPHFVSIWNVHLKPELVDAVARKVDQAIRTPSESATDLAVKLALIETFLTSNLTTARDAEERLAASLRHLSGPELAASGHPLLRLIKGRRT